MSPSCQFLRKQPCGNIPIDPNADDLRNERRMLDALSIKDDHQQQRRIDPYVDFPKKSSKQPSFQNNVHDFPSQSHYDNPTQTCAINLPRTFAPADQTRNLHNDYIPHQVDLINQQRQQQQQQQQQLQQQHHQQQQQQHHQQQQQKDPRKIPATDYSEMTKRFGTFFTWPKTAYLQPLELADAGFIYSGTGDAVKCYKCGVSLRNWEPNDTAWAEHEKWSPVCPLVIQKIQQVNTNKQPREYQQLTQEASYASLDENYLRRYKQQQQQQQQFARPPYETSRSLPTGAHLQYEARFNTTGTSYSPAHPILPSQTTNEYYHHQKPVQNASAPPSFQQNPTMVGYPSHSSLLPYFSQQPSVLAQYNNPLSLTLSARRNCGDPLSTQRNCGGENMKSPFSVQRNCGGENMKSPLSVQRNCGGENMKSPLSVQRNCGGENMKSETSETFATTDYKMRVPQESTYPFSSDSLETSPVRKERKPVTLSNAQTLVGMGFEKKLIQQTIDCYTSYASRSFSSLDDLAQAVLYFQDHGTLEGTPFGKDLNVNPSKAGEEMIYDRVSSSKPLSVKETETDRQSCKICMDNDVEVTFVPCGHLVVCESCALGMKLCPICRLDVNETVRTYYFGN